MSAKFYIHWKSNHILKMDKNLKVSEYSLYNFSDKEYTSVYHIPDGYISSITSLLTDTVSEKFIFTSGSKLYYFDGKILQWDLNNMYNMQIVKENVFFCDYLFLIVDKLKLYVLEIDQIDQFFNEMSDYYSTTELIFLHAKSCIELYKWRTLYDKIITVQINEKKNIMKIWMNADIKHELLLNPLNYI